jgi:hypothetical protein
MTGVVVNKPGVYPDLPDADYFADPVPWGSLSNSGAKLLMPPSCPALYRYWTDHPRPPKDEFDFGHAAHKMVLGVGPVIVPVEPHTTRNGTLSEDWNTNEIKAQVAEIRQSGLVPLKRSEFDSVVAMARALRAHPFAGKLLAPDDAQVELSVFWVDDETGVMRRGRYDILRTLAGGQPAIVDYKSTPNAAPEKCSKWMYDFRYHWQGAGYIDGARALGLGGEDTAFLLVFQEKDPPYLVTVAEPDPIALRAAREDNRRALEKYAECVGTDTWPGYAQDVIPLALPSWAERRFLAEEYA